ncbi:peptidoglycan DD-metalloendopeptidase family protein [Dyadobacter aurulentus]|uniref:peptidoglycan DD-metalloendopeptidase family protein n=1 Tax=Dyadobacter sp. UC 10 TaxID=2605428 RepID=UPI0011F1F217|nr:peptidoglycan DD-metalloendopeptidase family protein [Dyadobacter sp. UC 10]KAA0990523.1 peptidoglycan DD-metalloendopeptidase family protein [Dyadobacter sp. UC 10]
MSDLQLALSAFPDFAKIIQTGKPYKKLDFSAANKALVNRDLSETGEFSSFVFDELLQKNAYTGIGGYGEDRIIYRHRKHFGGDSVNARSIHLGTDIWIDAGEAVFAPLAGKVHSFAFNDNYGDYGPTIVLAHELADIKFYTLYGHLSLSSLEGMIAGKSIEAGEHFAFIGNYPENGDWPPHLHFQIIADMGNYQGDFPGVSSIQDKLHYLSLCPDPNLILRIPENA